MACVGAVIAIDMAPEREVDVRDEDGGQLMGKKKGEEKLRAHCLLKT
jgi:hypothetical protein